MLNKSYFIILNAVLLRLLLSSHYKSSMTTYNSLKNSLLLIVCIKILSTYRLHTMKIALSQTTIDVCALKYEAVHFKRVKPLILSTPI
jgi:hypothetical protein